jgi:hypothetical protein
MKAKLYHILTGLLMAACFTSYGQEIVGEFMMQCNKDFWNCDIQECSDGTLLVGTYSNRIGHDHLEKYLVCKITHAGELLDSVTFPYGWEILAHPTQSDVFVLPSYEWNEADSILSFRMTFIDSELEVIDEILTPIFIGVDYNTNQWSLDELFIDPQGDFIISYWTDFNLIDYWSDYAVYHMMRIGLDGTIISESGTDRILPPNWSNMHPGDSALVYEYFDVFNESPLQYYRMGGYIGENNEHPWSLFAYIFDDNLNLIDTLIFGNFSENLFFDYTGMEHITPISNDPMKETYLLSAQVCYNDNDFAASIAKYDKDNNLLAINRIESSSTIGYGSPLYTEAVDENTIYHAYQEYPTSMNEVMAVTRLDGDLNVVWNIRLPGDQWNYGYGHSLKVLQNGDIAAGFVSMRNSADRLYLYIIHDGYDATPEIVATESPFSLYPNPVKDQLILRFDDGTEPESVELYDLSGRFVSTKRNGLESIDMSAMPSGVYMLRVTMKDGTSYREKILKE